MKNKVINLFGKDNTPPNKGEKYSELLENFFSHFNDDFIDTEYIEDIIEFSMNAWNFANIKVLLPNDENKNIDNYISEEEVDEINVVLLNKMIDYKIAKFKKYTNFIIDYELKESNDGFDLFTVITQTEEDYLSSMMDNLDNEEEDFQGNFEENYINRCAIVIKPLQPFIDWHNNLNPDDILVESDFDEVNVYLVNDNVGDLESWLKKKFDTYFKLELEDWHTNKKEWPQKRTYKMFKQWFRVDVSSAIYDLEKNPVLKIVD